MQEAEEIVAWFRGRIPDGWFTSAPDVVVDREEILVVGPVAGAEAEPAASPAARTAAHTARVSRFREETRAARVKVATEAEHRFGRKVSWGVRVDDLTVLFTTVSVPVMTRLRQPERLVLDTLVSAGVARSRADALAWSVRLVGKHAEDWLGELRAAMAEVERVRGKGPA